MNEMSFLLYRVCVSSRQIAVALKKDPVEVRRLNLYREGDTAYCNMKMEGCTVGRCFEECLVQSRSFVR